MRKISIDRTGFASGQQGVTIVIDGVPTKIEWASEAAVGLQTMYGVSLEAELLNALMKELQPYNLTEEERIELVRLLLAVKE